MWPTSKTFSTKARNPSLINLALTISEHFLNQQGTPFSKRTSCLLMAKGRLNKQWLILVKVGWSCMKTQLKVTSMMATTRRQWILSTRRHLGCGTGLNIKILTKSSWWLCTQLSQKSWARIFWTVLPTSKLRLKLRTLKMCRQNCFQQQNLTWQLVSCCFQTQLTVWIQSWVFTIGAVSSPQALLKPR